MRPAHFTLLAGAGLLLALAATTAWWRWSEAASRRVDRARGDELNTSLRRYQQQHRQLPATDDWRALKAIGFTGEELERAYPQYTKVTSNVYQLVFALDYNGPYYMWDSGEQRWKDGVPDIITKRN